MIRWEAAQRLRRLELLEEVIDAGFTRACEVWLALEEIRTEKLYKERGYRSFEAYCQERLQKGSRRVRQLIAGAKIAGLIAATQSGTRVPPANEKQMRVLASLDGDTAGEVWAEVTADGHQPTAAEVAQAVARRRHLEAVEELERLPSQDKARVLQEESDHDHDTQLARSRREGRKRLLEEIERLVGRLRKKHGRLADVSDLDRVRADEALERYCAACRRQEQLQDEALEGYLTLLRAARRRAAA